MADTGIFATTEQVQRKAGLNASPVANVEAYINDFISQAESEINAITRFNWSDGYAALDVDVKGLLTQAASNLAAIYVINYDMSGYSSRTEAENMVNILRDAYLRAVSLLRDQKVKTFIEGA